jgi:hypothetical protein
MLQRGRRSAAANLVKLATTSPRSRLTAPEFLKADERALFTALADDNRHLTRTDVPLLAIYAAAVFKVNKLGRQKDVGQWEKASRMMLSLARSLRLTVQSATEPRAVGRQRRDARPDLVAEYLAETGDDNAE